MVLNVSKRQRNGVCEWVFQRITNFLVVLYALLMASCFLSESADNYDALVAFFSEGWVVLFSALVLIMIG